jgi:hypothetical protein
MSRLFAFRALLIALAPALVGAQTERDRPADWTGFYALANARDLAGTGLKPVAPGGELSKLIVAHLQPWAIAKMEATDGVADDPGGVCQADGIFRYPNFAGRFLWLPERDRIVMVFGEINTAGVRRIYLDREHPKNLLPTWNGHSIGHWEHDSLVVDTVGFNDKSWLMTGREPHTEETHLMERIRRVADGAFIEIVGVVEDRHALTSAYTYTRYYKKQNAEPGENVCSEDLEIWRKWRNEALKKQYDRAKQVK